MNGLNAAEEFCTNFFNIFGTNFFHDWRTISLMVPIAWQFRHHIC